MTAVLDLGWAGAPAGRTLGVKNGWAEWDGSWLIHSTGYARAAEGTCGA